LLHHAPTGGRIRRALELVQLLLQRLDLLLKVAHLRIARSAGSTLRLRDSGSRNRNKPDDQKYDRCSTRHGNLLR
jgi:hypothetical protein